MFVPPCFVSQLTVEFSGVTDLLKLAAQICPPDLLDIMGCRHVLTNIYEEEDIVTMNTNVYATYTARVSGTSLPAPAVGQFGDQRRHSGGSSASSVHSSSSRAAPPLPPAAPAPSLFGAAPAPAPAAFAPAAAAPARPAAPATDPRVDQLAAQMNSMMEMMSRMMSEKKQ